MENYTPELNHLPEHRYTYRVIDSNLEFNAKTLGMLLDEEEPLRVSLFRDGLKVKAKVTFGPEHMHELTSGFTEDGTEYTILNFQDALFESEDVDGETYCDGSFSNNDQEQDFIFAY